jgi:putative methionine-R-sulfoxide reductase with GAF domain
LSISVMQDEEKPWKTDLAQRSAQRRTVVAGEIEGAIKKAPSFEDGLNQAVEILKKRFARFSAITAYVADGEGLALHTAVERPAGPERIGSTEGPLGQAAQAEKPTVAADVRGDEGWQKVGFTSGSVLVAPVRTDAGLWAILEIWSDFRDAFTPQDVKMLQTVTAALARKTPAA